MNSVTPLMRDDKQDICKELGDVLLHVAFYAKIGSETGDFDMKDVCDRLCEKLIFRHPPRIRRRESGNRRTSVPKTGNS